MAEFDTSGLQPLDTTGLVPVDQQFDTSNLVPLDTSGLVPVDESTGESPLSERVRAYETENPFFTRMGQRLKAGFLNIGSSIQGTHAVGEVERLQNIAPFLSRIDQGEKLERPDFANTGLLDPERQRIEQYQRSSPEERQKLLGQWQSEIVEAAKSTAEQRAESAAIPRNPAVADFSRAFGSKDYLGATEILLKNPVGIIGQVGTESAPTMLAALAAGIVNPLLGAGVMGGSSAAQEYGSSVIDYIGQQGVDTNDPQALLAALQNRDLVGNAADYATKRAAVIGTVDALSGLVAGKMLVPGQLIAGPVKREAVNELVAQPLLQAGMGAAGEAGGQLASTGKINDPASVAIEAIGEFATAPVEAAAFGTQRFRESAPAPGPQAQPAAPVGAAGGEPSPQAAPATIPDPGTRVGLRREGAAPEPVVVEAVQDGYVFFRDPDGNVDAATVDDFKRDLTAPPPATKAVDATTVPTPPPEVTAPPPPETGDINDFDPYAIREPVKARPTEPSPQAKMELPDTAKIAALQRQARLWEVAAAEAEERATRGEPGARTPEEIAFMRHSAQQAAAEAAAMARTATPPRVSQDATAATPEQMAARGMGALSAAAPAASEATTGPQTFEVAPKPAPEPTQATLEPVARSEAEVPQPIAERPQQPPVPWQQRLRQRIAARSAPLNNQDLLAKQLGVTPQDVAKELTSIAAGRNAPVQIMQGRVKIDPKTKQPVQSKFAGKFRYAPQPTGKVTQSLSQFVADSGGMAPASFAGEITARDLDKASIKFRGRLVNPAARMNVEMMADHALEAGWQIPFDSTGQHADVDEFLNMLAQDHAGRRKFYALGEEPVEEGQRPATRQARKAQALARLKELGFEPRGATVEELENEVDAYENIIGEMPRADAPELHLGMENEAVDRLDQEAQDALRQEAKDDFPHEYDENWYRQEVAEGPDATQPAAAASLPARGEQAGAEREGAQVTPGRDEGAAATASSIGAETGRLAATESGQTRRFTDLTHQASAQISSIESASSWVVEQGKSTGNEYTTVTGPDGSLILAGTSNLKDQTIFAAPIQLRTPGQTVTVLHNHPETAALSRPDVSLLAFPGAGFVGAISHNGKVSAAALGSSVKIPTNNDEFDALSRWLSASYEAVSSAFARTEPDIYKRQELVMRTLGASGLLEYHTNHAINGDMVPAVNQAAILARRALTNANILTDRAGVGVLHRPTFYVSPADTLAAISKRTAEISAGRNRASNAGVVGKSDLGQANRSGPASRTRAGRNERVSDNVESTGQFRQPGQIEIDQRRLVSGADRPAVRTTPPGVGEVPGRAAGAEQGTTEQAGAPGDRVGAQGNRKNEGPTSVIARLIADESGALTAPDWKRIKETFTNLRGAKTPKQIAAQANAVPIGHPDTLRRVAMVGPYVYNGAWLASQDRPSAVYFNALLNQQATRSQLETQAFEKAAPYFRLSKEDMRTVDAMLEYYRLYGVTPRRTGRQLVVKIPETRPPFGEAMPTLSKPGQILAADAKMTDAILDLTEMFGDVWRNMHEAIARERGYTREFSEKAIQAQIDGANDRRQKRAAETAMDVWRAMQETARQGYTVPLQRYGDTYISVTPKAPEDAVSINSPVHVEFIDTKSFFRNPFKSQRGGTADQSVDQRMAELRKKFPPSKFNISSGQVTPNSVATLDIPALERALMAMNSATDHKHEAVIDDLLHQVYQNRMAGFRKQARNVGGYSTDFERAIADYIRQTSSTIARLSYRDTIQSAYDATQHHADPAVRKYWENFKHYNEREGGDFNGLRKLGFFMMMWGSPASAALDLTQTPLITQFQLASWAGIRAPKLAHEAMVEALSAVRPTARHGLRVDLSRVGRTDAERALLKSMAAEGRLGPQISREFQGSELSTRARNARPHLKKMAVLWEYGSSMKNAAEEVNRVAAALAAFRAAQNPQLLDKAAKVYADDQLFREQMGTKPDPAALARFFVDDTQFIAGKINRAPAMRGIGSLVFQFKNYPLNYVRLMHKNFTRMGKEGKIIGGMMLVALLMASGLLGAPFAEDALKGGEAIYKSITGIDPMLEYNFRKWAADAGFGEYGAELLTRGIGRDLFGADMGQRIGMGELFPSDSITDTLPLASAIISRVQETMERGSRGQPAGATAAAANFLFGKGGYDLARAYAQTKEGVKTKYGSTIQSAADTTLGDVALRALGIQPTKITRKTEKTYAGTRIAAAANDAKNRLTTELATYIVDAGAAREAGDKARADEITAKLNARIAEVAQQFADPGTPPWQKLTVPSRTALRRRILSIILPEVARLKATPRPARQEIMNIPYPE